MCDIELVLAYKTPQGYADCSRTLEEYKNQIRAEVIDDVLKIKAYRFGNFENHEFIFVDDILKLKEQKHP